jgi:hypothetical protein
MPPLAAVPAGHAQVRGDDVELAAVGRADDVRVAHALFADGGAEHGPAAVQLPPVQRVVASAEREADLLAVAGGVATEIDEQVAGVLGRLRRCSRGIGRDGWRRHHGQGEGQQGRQQSLEEGTHGPAR